VITYATAQGSRPDQQDRLVIFPTPSEWPLGGGTLLAVFDGHGGEGTAERCARSAPTSWHHALIAEPEYVLPAFRRLIQSFVEAALHDSGGTTASIAYIDAAQSRIYTAVLGDSPIAVFDASGQLRVAASHNVRTNERERARAEERGGLYRAGYLHDSQDLQYGLQMSRAIGDRELGRILDREPEVARWELNDASACLIGTDGLFAGGEVPNAALERLVGMIQRGADASALVQDALERGSADNVTAIVWRPGPNA
jgi:protein phosphatase 1L